MEPVLRCRDCNKPFDKESTLKRHGYYCRSRKAGKSIRSRSCLSCVKGKARCDHKQPSCSRCVIKAVECTYPASTPGRVTPNLHLRYNASRGRHDATPPSQTDFVNTEIVQDANLDDEAVLIDEIGSLNQDVLNFGDISVDWSGTDVNFDEYVALGLHTSNKIVGNRLVTTSPPLRPLLHDESTLSYAIPQVQSDELFSKSWTPSPPYRIFQSLAYRPRMEVRPHRTSSLMLRYLGSYPLMIARQDTLPPYIHSSLIKPDVQNDDMDSLNNCISLMHMLGSGVKGSRKLFWKNVRLECERFCQEYTNMNRWELLATLQALSIYIIIRLEEGETDDNNLDSLLVAAVSAISRRSNGEELIHKTQTSGGINDVGQSWREWVFEESRRRLCVVYRIVNMLVYFEPAAICDLTTDLVIAPLPAKKQLWNADDEFAWQRETERQPRDRADFGLNSNGDLVQLSEDQLHCHSTALSWRALDGRSSFTNEANWKEWCAEMDEFGGIVMLAASLVK